MLRDGLPVRPVPVPDPKGRAVTRVSLNTQQPSPVSYLESGDLRVVDVFRTIQGEGPFAGLPAVFVRLAGCNLACPDCDTDYTTDTETVSVFGLIGMVQAQFDALWERRVPESTLVVITGGEPFRQNLGPFVRELLGKHPVRVQVETNGTLFPGADAFPFAADVTLVVSPKVGQVAHGLRPYVHHLKYVVKAADTPDPATGLPLHALGNAAPVAGPWPGFRGTVWVQPADEQNDECNRTNLQYAVDLAMRFGYRVSVQLHKIMEMP